ncbi:hypothetical protein B5M44_04285 [Shinella sumterensis]|uniref:hypothetical protein n=1 Tax=Shinella sumterensis TaxID=1967501 RepID=UPI00106EED9D|nr:hypothetical protein [Shinella sumterensis]MCD1264040.1 hypothetical protein [Shinella sumterensis]TFE99424.1 hypothetical protein B5M44_04285 [Shinella sumterensis]
MTRLATDDFNPLAVAGPGHNNPPEELSPFELLKQEIEDLFEEAKNFCDGEPIDSEAMADVITELHDRIHECGKRAETLRVDEKKPLDDKIAEIQTKFHPLIGNTKAGKGKVILAKEACQTLLTPWRKKVADEKAAKAARVAKEAEAARAAAQAAMQASSGNLAEREAAEELLADAKALEKTARRSEKAATTGLGLRTVWTAVLEDPEKALDWAYGRAADEFIAVAQRNADEAVRAGLRQVPGFVVKETKVAA